MSNTPFLTAEWRNLLNITYPVAPHLLLPYLPLGVELDLQNGNAFVSLVAFDFLNTRVKGLPIPFHINFPEINLRFYVKYNNGQRAVCFIREFVPKMAIAWVANWLYNEPYKAINMHSHTAYNSQSITITHTFKVANKWQHINVCAHNESYVPDSNSTAHYFKEHDLGFGIDGKGNTLSYEVKHPVWAIYPIKNYDLSLDFGLVYGKQWAVLNNTTPLSAILAVGSAIEVYAPNVFSTNPAKD
jgi:hypothetical protein